MPHTGCSIYYFCQLHINLLPCKINYKIKLCERLIVHLCVMPFIILYTHVQLCIVFINQLVDHHLSLSRIYSAMLRILREDYTMHKHPPLSIARYEWTGAVKSEWTSPRFEMSSRGFNPTIHNSYKSHYAWLSTGFYQRCCEYPGNGTRSICLSTTPNQITSSPSLLPSAWDVFNCENNIINIICLRKLGTDKQGSRWKENNSTFLLDWDTGCNYYVQQP